MLGRREDPPRALQLVDAAGALEPGMIEDVLLGGALRRGGLGDLDVAIDRVGGEVDRETYSGSIRSGMGRL
jgi:hypothetical protein